MVNIFILIVPFIKVAGESDTCGWIWKRRFKCSNRGKVIEWLRSRIQNIKVYDDVDIESGSWLCGRCATYWQHWPRLDYLQSRLLEKVHEWDEKLLLLKLIVSCNIWQNKVLFAIWFCDLNSNFYLYVLRGKWIYSKMPFFFSKAMNAWVVKEDIFFLRVFIYSDLLK